MPKKAKKTQLDTTSRDINLLSSSQRREFFFNNNIPIDILQPLLEQSKADKKVPNKLGEIYLAIVKKVGGMGSWRGYTPDYKEEMESRALEHLVKYGHNFDRTKTKKDPVNYLIQITWRAFQQSLKRSKLQNKVEGTEFNQLLDSMCDEPNHYGHHDFS